MGTEQSMLKPRHTFPKWRSFFESCFLPFFVNTMAAIPRAIVSVKIAAAKNQNKRMNGAFSMNDLRPLPIQIEALHALVGHVAVELADTGEAFAMVCAQRAA